ncbi:MAG: hypothetical protein H0X51_09615 [Parachlamydiaceae bacterium]|nr:hypothetical protein [Parachlamydiaceae bacterium]
MAIATITYNAITDPLTAAFGYNRGVLSRPKNEIVLQHMGYTSAYFKIVHLIGINLPSILYAAKNIPWIAVAAGIMRIVKALYECYHNKWLPSDFKLQICCSHIIRGALEMSGFGFTLFFTDFTITVLRHRLN